MTKDEIIKELSWDNTNYLQPGDPKNKDFFEADVSKIIARETAMLEEIIGEYRRTRSMPKNETDRFIKFVECLTD
jgi:hypothetical protein